MSDSARKQITALLSMLTEKMISCDYDPRSYWSKEVTFDYGTPNQVCVDYMKFEPLNNTVSGIEKGNFYCYEVKSCEADFLSGHGLNFIGDYNYIVCRTNFMNGCLRTINFRSVLVYILCLRIKIN